MEYKANDDIIKALKYVCIQKGVSLASVARKLNITPQNFNALLHKKQFSFADAARIAAALDCGLHFYFLPEDQKQQAPGDPER